MRAIDPTPALVAKAVLAAAALVLCAASMECAASWGGLVGYSSDNILHGRSLGDGRPTWIGDLHHERGNWTIGLAATTERPPQQSRGAQLTLYLDRRWRLDEAWSVKLGVARYESPWSTFADDLRYHEVGVALGHRGRWHLAVTHTPDLPAWSRQRYLRGAATYVEAGANLPLAGRLSTELGIGHADVQGVAQRDYFYANAGLRYGLGDIYLHVTLHWADPPAARYRAAPGPRSHWVGALVWVF